MRPLTLHSSALNDAEYTEYTLGLRALTEDDGPGAAECNEDIAVGVREARAWLRGRYAALSPSVIDTILRLFCPNLAPADVLTGGQVFAILRLVHHALAGKEVDRSLVFMQAHPDSLASNASAPSPTPASAPDAHSPQPSHRTTNPSPFDANPFFARTGTADRPAPLSSSASAPVNVPPTLPPKPHTNPFLARRGSDEGARPSTGTSSARARASASSEGRLPPLPPRKPSAAAAVPPPRHASQTPHVHRSPTPTLTPAPSILMQQSLHATRVGKSLKEAEHRLEQERRLEVLRSSRAGPSPSPAPVPTPDSRAPSAERAGPALPPRPKVSPPASTASATSVSSARSLEQVARAQVRTRPPPPPPPLSLSARSSPACTPPRPLADLPQDPPPTHPDRGFPPPPGSPRVLRSRSMHYPAPPASAHRRRPESVQIAPADVVGVDVPLASPVPQHPLSRHHSLSSTLSGRSRGSQSDGGGSALSEPIANLQKTLAGLHHRTAPRLDSARYKAEAALNPRGFVQHGQPATRWMRQEGEERLMDDVDEGLGQDDDEGLSQDVTGDDSSGPEDEWQGRLRRLQMSEKAANANGASRRVGTERDELKWPVNAEEGWTRL